MKSWLINQDGCSDIGLDFRKPWVDISGNLYAQKVLEQCPKAFYEHIMAHFPSAVEQITLGIEERQRTISSAGQALRGGQGGSVGRFFVGLVSKNGSKERIKENGRKDEVNARELIRNISQEAKGLEEELRGEIDNCIQGLHLDIDKPQLRSNDSSGRQMNENQPYSNGTSKMHESS